MMKKLMWVACFVILFGASAIVAHAQTAVDPFAGDSHIILNGPDPCSSIPDEPYCVPLTYSGTGATYFTLSVPTPIPEPPPDTCAADNFSCIPLTASCPSMSDTTCFFGFTFFDFMGDNGTVTNGDMFSLYANVPITLSLTGTGLTCSGTGCVGPDVTFTPEPGTALLYVSGLALLVGFGRKRFRTNCIT